MFFYLYPWKPHKCVLKPLEQGLFLQDIELRDHMSRFTLKMNVFPSISLETHKCVLKPTELGSVFWDDGFEGSHA